MVKNLLRKSALKLFRVSLKLSICRAICLKIVQKKPQNRLGFFGRRPLCKSSCYSSKKFEANNIKMDHMYCSQWKLFVFLLSENSKNSVTYFS